MSEKPLPPWAHKLSKVLLWGFILVVGVPSIFQLGKMGYHWIRPQSSAPVTYLQQIQPIAQNSSEILNGITPLFTHPEKYPPEEALQQVAEAKNRFASLKKEAEIIQAPSEWNETHKQFVTAMTDYFDAFQLTEEGLKQDDGKKISEAADLLVKGANGMNQVTASINRQEKKE